MDLLDVFEKALKPQEFIHVGIGGEAYAQGEFVRVQLYSGDYRLVNGDGSPAITGVKVKDDMVVNKGDFVTFTDGGYVKRAGKGDELLGRVL